MTDLLSGQHTPLTRRELACRLDEIIACIGKRSVTARDLKVANLLLEQLRKRVAP